MRFIITLTILVICAFAQAQTVENVAGDTATVSLQGAETLSVGDKVSFIDADLNVAGQGEVNHVSDSGRIALVKVLSGQGKAGMSLEKVRSTSVTKKHSPETEVENTNPERTKNAMYASLDEEDRRILRNGEISTGSYVLGGIFGTWPVGLGIGHAIQGRYMEKGWMFTAGELGSVALMVVGADDCTDALASSSRKSCNSSAILWGVVGYVGFRLWEIYDVWVTPSQINRRYRELNTQMKPTAEFKPVLAPTSDGFVAGLQMQF